MTRANDLDYLWPIEQPSQSQEERSIWRIYQHRLREELNKLARDLAASVEIMPERTTRSFLALFQEEDSERKWREAIEHEVNRKRKSEPLMIALETWLDKPPLETPFLRARAAALAAADKGSIRLRSELAERVVQFEEQHMKMALRYLLIATLAEAI